MSKLSGFHMLTVVKYFVCFNDFVHLQMSCKKYRDTIEKLHFNPIPLTTKTRKYFTRLETLHLWNEKDENFGNTLSLTKTLSHENFYEIVVWFSVKSSVAENFVDKNYTFKNVEIDKALPSQSKYMVCRSIYSLTIEHTSLLNENLKIFEIPDGVTSIANHSLNGLTGVTKIAFPKSIKSIGLLNYDTMHSLKIIEIKSPITYIDNLAIFGNHNLIGLPLQRGITVTSLSTSFYSQTSQIDLPESVTKICELCFDNCTSLQAINLKTSIVSLGKQCFVDCSHLTSVTLTSHITSIETGCFRNCGNLLSLTIPNTIQRYEGCLFNGCVSLKNITIKSDVTSLGYNCFSYCKTLKKVVIPSNIKIIEDNCFEECEILSKIEVKGVVERLPRMCFYCCVSLKKAVITKGVIIIGESCFKLCISLSVINIPDGVNTIGHSCFEECKSLKTLQIPRSVVKIGERCFKGCDKLKTLIVSSRVVNKYLEISKNTNVINPKK
ncbi:hypothetical protein EIN_419330 [Entamoeba invadens IP1]|uniref:Leucine rich repeat containing protein BspA family protein n=1 Tax=Entamoeba invadens IP1 TaxID=370355 RepID=A0A0A1U1V5_ENTIV|nr:hypothetical protein EIN_419330 [Entamoeba invadens IP1]ELP88004.1 hypothetical protein EIN_419330 [Entamoeba invadens IP1]|eukprot:XP_004254775.1 hypothetical protein EIN_419330 [Entamoeba invadens IP1]